MFRVGQVVQKGKDHENMTPPTHAFNDVQGINAQVSQLMNMVTNSRLII
jgi:hypothetical protein